MSVPILPGVPPLAFGVGIAASVINLLTQDAPGLVSASEQITWGIYDSNGNPVITGDSVRSFEYNNEQRVADYPIEQGGFVSYNKTPSPFDTRLVFVQSGSIDQRAAFLNELQARINDTQLYTVITDVVRYAQANIVRLGYRRTSSEGATLLSVDVWVREIRQVPAGQFSNTAQPDAAAQNDDGNLAPQQPVAQTTTDGTSTTPGMITSQYNSNGANQTLAVTDAKGNSSPTAIGSTITYDGNNGPATGVVKSVSDKGYTLTNGDFVGKNLVGSITPPGSTVVQ